MVVAFGVLGVLVLRRELGGDWVAGCFVFVVVVMAMVMVRSSVAVLKLSYRKGENGTYMYYVCAYLMCGSVVGWMWL